MAMSRTEDALGLLKLTSPYMQVDMQDCSHNRGPSVFCLREMGPLSLAWGHFTEAQQVCGDPV